MTTADLWHLCCDRRHEFTAWCEANADALASRRQLASDLTAKLPRGSEAVYLGYCAVCQQHQHFTYDWLYSSSDEINWRERLVCKGCGLSNRLRLAAHQARTAVDLQRSHVYLTEQTTPLAALLQACCPGLIGSEYLGPKAKPGSKNWRGLRHEDFTRLSFADASFDLVMSFDVLEHIPDYRAALREARRVLRPGGALMLSVPLHLGSEMNIVRARVGGDGEVEHLLQPEYHGDPVEPGKGILCFCHFGWELLNDLKSAGFSASSIDLFWSSDYAYIDSEQVLVRAVT